MGGIVNGVTRVKILAGLILILVAMAALSAAPAYAGQSWEQSPDCDQSIAVWRRLPLVNTRHRIEFGGYARDVGATRGSSLPEIAFPGAVGSEIPAHAGRRWINPPAGLVQSRWDWAAMSRRTHSQALPPTQIAPTGYISYTIRPEDIVSQSEILANPYYAEKINSVYWTRPFYQTERQRQRVTEECVFQETVWRILVRNDPSLASITDPDQRRLEVLRVAAVNPALAERMPGFRNEALPDQGLWRQIVVEWLERIQKDHPHAFRYWLDRCLEGAKMDAGVVGTVIHLPTPERPTPSAEAPELSGWGLKWDAGRKAYVTVDNRYGLPAGSEAAWYFPKITYMVDRGDGNPVNYTGAIGFSPRMAEALWKATGKLVLPVEFPEDQEVNFTIKQRVLAGKYYSLGLRLPVGSFVVAPFSTEKAHYGNFITNEGENGEEALLPMSGGNELALGVKDGNRRTYQSPQVVVGTRLFEISSTEIFVRSWSGSNICVNERHYKFPFTTEVLFWPREGTVSFIHQ
ncbi:MAG: hypothetical protein H5T64_13390 [Chloroflexi bacterium]|nr:hypothetical protein [Chloroflexota bacterium]